MREMFLVLLKEWQGFAKSDKSAFAVYGILVLLWSGILVANAQNQYADSGLLWWIFFSVIVTSNFSNTVFIAERMSGAMEIVLTSGIPRWAILCGKLLFVIGMASAMGGLCLGFAFLWTKLGAAPMNAGGQSHSLWLRVISYIAAAFLNASCNAWLSLRLPNPRLSHFANLLILALIVGVHATLGSFFYVPPWNLAAALSFAGAFFLFMGVRDFYSERVVAPLSF
jgi:ABC-type Na+ efflux pump permease subunit